MAKKGNVVTRKVKILKYKEFDYIVEEAYPGAEVAKKYRFVGIKDSAESIGSDMFIYLFKTTYDDRYECRKLTPNSTGEYNLVVEERDLRIENRDVYKSVRNYFCLSQIEFTQDRLDSLLRQLQIGSRCPRVEAIPLARNSSSFYTEVEKENSEIENTLTTIYLTDYLQYAVKLSIDYRDSHKLYTKWLNDDEDPDIKDSSGRKRKDAKLLNDAAFHLAYVIGPRAKSISPFEMNVGFALATTLSTAVLGPLSVAAIGVMPGIYNKWKEFCSEYNFHRQQLMDLKEVKGQSAVDEMGPDAPSGGWKYADYWRKKFIEEEKAYIEEYTTLSKMLVEWIDTSRFRAVQFDYEFGTDDDRTTQENKFGDIIDKLSISVYGKAYLRRYYDNTKRQLDTMLSRVRSSTNPDFARYRDIVNKALDELTPEDRTDLVKFAYARFNLTEQEWWAFRLFARAKTLNTGFAKVLKEVSTFIGHETTPVYRLLNIPKEYLRRQLYSGDMMRLNNKNTAAYIDGWKEVMTGTVIKSVEEDINKVTRKIKRDEKVKMKFIYTIDELDSNKVPTLQTLKFEETVEIQPSRHYSVVFEEKIHKRQPYLIARLKETDTVKLPNWADNILDEQAFKIFGTVLDAVGMISTIKDIIKKKDAVYGSLKAITLIMDVVKIWMEYSGREHLEVGKVMIPGRSLDVAGNCVEAFLNGKDAVTNFLEEDYDAGLCYVLSVASNAAVIVLTLTGALTGPAGLAISFAIFVTNYIISTFTRYFDDDDYELWLQYCSFGKNYPYTGNRSKPDWAVADFKDWKDDFSAQLDSYQELLSDYKLTILPLMNSSDSMYGPICALNIVIKPKSIFEFSVVRVTMKIDGNSIVDDYVFNNDNARFKTSGDIITEIEATLVDGDSPEMNVVGLQAVARKWFGTPWLEKAKKNEITGFLSAIDQNEKDKPYYQGEVEIIVKIDLYDNGEIVLERDAKHRFDLSKSFIPTVIEESAFYREILSKINRRDKGPFLNKSDKDFLNSQYIRRECTSCNRESICRVHDYKNGLIDDLFSDGNISCMRLLDADDNSEYDNMSFEDKCRIRALLTEISYYVNNRVIDPEIEFIF